MQNKLEEIKRIVIIAVPSIMNLEFGCNVLAKKSNRILTICGTYEGDPLTLDYFRGFPQVLMVDGYVGEGLVEILGRKIGIAEILITIRNTPNINLIFYIDDQGHIWNRRKKIKAVSFWNLLEDDLTKQSESTINFIHSLLTNN